MRLEHPLALPNGMSLQYQGRLLVHAGYAGSWLVDLRQSDGTPFQIRNPDGSLMPVDIDWMIDEAMAGRLLDSECPLKPIGGRRSVNLKLPYAACIARDPKVEGRFKWAMAALEAGVGRSVRQAKRFIAKRTDLPVIAVSERSLINWMVRLNEDPRRRIGTLMACAGRLEGQSQLHPLVNAIVHQEAAAFWVGDHPTKFDAAAGMVGTFDDWQKSGKIPPEIDCPTYETVRYRISRLESSITIEAREGRRQADRFIGANGEPVEVLRPFERVTLDGVVHRQITVFSDEWPEATARMKSVFGMDSASTYVFPGQTFSGPFCPEMARGALVGIMCPMEQDEGDPDDRAGSDCAGIPETLHPDNDKALIPPGSIPGLVNLVSVVELPKPYHSDAKSTHESFHSFLHRRLSKLPGTVIPIHPGRDPRYDPVSEAEISRSRFAWAVELARRAWNNEPKASLGGRSPKQALRESMKHSPVRTIPRADIELELGRTVEVTITPDGTVYDNLQYRGNAKGLQSVLDAYYADTPHSERIKATARCSVTAVVYDHDLGFIDILDPKGARHCRLEAVDRDYTMGLTRLEHREYRRMMRKGHNGSRGMKDRLRDRSITLRDMRKTFPELAFKRRSMAAALLERDDFRSKSGDYGSGSKYLENVLSAIPTELADKNRKDRRRPPPQPFGKAKPDDDRPSDDDYELSDADNSAEQNKRGGTVPDEDPNYGAIRWSDDEEAEDDEEDEG